MVDLIELEPFLDQYFGSNYKKKDVLITPLKSGLSSTSTYILQVNQQKFVIREFNKKYDKERKLNEIVAHKYASDEIQISPKILYIHPDVKFMIIEYIDGRAITRNDLKNPDIIRILAKLIRNLHNYKGEFIQYRPQSARAEKDYNKALSNDIAFPMVFTELYKEYIQEGQKMLLQKKDIVLCHSDLSPENIMISNDNKIYIIDFTAASWDYRYNDLGYFALLNGLNEKQKQLLLSEYFDNKIDSHNLENFNKAISRTYFLTSLVWFVFSEKPEDKEVSKELRIQVLDDLLQNNSIKEGAEYIENNEIVPLYSEDKESLRLYALGFLKTYIKTRTQGKNLNDLSK